MLDYINNNIDESLLRDCEKNEAKFLIFMYKVTIAIPIKGKLRVLISHFTHLENNKSLVPVF